MPRPPDALRSLYRHTAPHYEAAIAPVMRPFAQDLVRRATLGQGDTVLDVGTGTGVLARQVAGLSRRVIGVDIALPMLEVARRQAALAGLRGVCFLLADANDLGALAASCCDVVFASFGLGECHPARALRAVARVLRPGGRFYLQEWGPYDGPQDPRWIVDDTLADFATASAQGLRLDLRRFLAAPRPWDRRLQDVEDYTHALAGAGFTPLHVEEGRPVTVAFQPGVSAFLRYALAWASRRLELEALDESARHAFCQTVTRRLEPLTDPRGVLLWNPLLFRATSVRKF